MLPWAAIQLYNPLGFLTVYGELHFQVCFYKPRSIVIKPIWISDSLWSAVQTICAKTINKHPCTDFQTPCLSASSHPNTYRHGTSRQAGSKCETTRRTWTTRLYWWHGAHQRRRHLTKHCVQETEVTVILQHAFFAFFFFFWLQRTNITTFRPSL